MTDKLVLCWFRQDLRLADNPALTAAARSGRVVPVYVLDDINSGDWKMGAASRWWLHQSLLTLNRSLDDRLWVLGGDPLLEIPRLVEKLGITEVYWNRCYEPWRIARDGRLKAALQEADIAVQSSNGSLLWEPWQVTKQDGAPYRVFTPFYQRGCLSRLAPAEPGSRPGDLRTIECTQSASRIETLGLLPEQDWHQSLAAHWMPGESGAQEQLSRFLADGLGDYTEGRDFPSRRAVSRLSPHLHFGELSPQQAWHSTAGQAVDAKNERQVEHFHRELAWREFSYNLLYHFPALPRANFNTRFDDFPWRDDADLFRSWCCGLTGYPIVDAGMRELWETGYMHNRVRMIVASFLVKNLLIHWHRGEEWFWDCLVDADLASNSASWQWVAGSGADAAPYFRIFNPVTQGRKFDSQGKYVRRWVPELTALPDKYLHDPGSAPEAVLEGAGIRLGQDYPRPIVDLKTSREAALEAWGIVRDSS